MVKLHLFIWSKCVKSKCRQLHMRMHIYKVLHKVTIKYEIFLEMSNITKPSLLQNKQ